MKKPTVIGKKLSENEIHFIYNTLREDITSIQEENNIISILSKLGNIKSKEKTEEEYESFNMNATPIKCVNIVNNIRVIDNYDDIDEDGLEVDYN